MSRTSLARSEDNEPVVYVVDDDPSVRFALSELLMSTGLRVHTFASSQEFLAHPRHTGPSCLILDVRLRGESGLTFQQELIKNNVPIPVLFMTGHGDIEMSVKAMKAGAIDFLPKPFRDQDMLDAVEQAIRRDRERLEAEECTAALRAAYKSLTVREKEVMALVVTGLLNKQIAWTMNLSEITVKTHRGQAMKKMSAVSVADLVRKAEALGLAKGVPQPQRG
ncbi:response regulator transcription factor [Pararobbsia alpina]|uniref:response regulator transcription factor n=1 Tax=Pararobbsia alpina TaxID=621374 RepID=UPI0039A77B75